MLLEKPREYSAKGLSRADDCKNKDDTSTAKIETKHLLLLTGGTVRFLLWQRIRSPILV